MKVYADFVKPTQKVELMRIRQQSRSEPFIMEHPFVPQCLLRDFDLKYMPESEASKEPVKRVFVKYDSVFRNWREDKTRDYIDCANLDF